MDGATFPPTELTRRAKISRSSVSMIDSIGVPKIFHFRNAPVLNNSMRFVSQMSAKHLAAAQLCSKTGRREACYSMAQHRHERHASGSNEFDSILSHNRWHKCEDDFLDCMF